MSPPQRRLDLLALNRQLFGEPHGKKRHFEQTGLALHSTGLLEFITLVLILPFWPLFSTFRIADPMPKRL